MKFDCKDLWSGTPAIKLLEKDTLPKGLFRISLSDFLHVWSGFPTRNLTEKRQRLERIFNTDYFDDCIVLTDAASLSKLVSTNFSESSPKNGSGFIYMYTYEDNVLAGLYEQGIFWWKTTRYEAKLKIGRTEQHPFRRIDQQLDTRTNIPDPPILLAALWTNLVAPCERSIHIELKEQGKRLTDSRGDDAKGGVEWFKDTPTESLPTIHKWVKYYRVIEGTLPNKVIVKQVYFSENVITLLHINGWLELPRPEIFSVKIKSTSHIIIRLRDRRRCVLNLLSLENKELDFAMHILLKNLYLIKNNGTHKTYMS